MLLLACYLIIDIRLVSNTTHYMQRIYTVYIMRKYEENEKKHYLNVISQLFVKIGYVYISLFHVTKIHLLLLLLYLHFLIIISLNIYNQTYIIENSGSKEAF